MKKTTQVKKSKNVQELPSFSIGLTPSDEDKRNDTDSSSSGGQKIKRKTGAAKGNEKKNKKKKEHKKGDESIASRGRNKKPQIEAQDSDETSSDDENERNGKKVSCAVENVKQDMVKKDSDADARLRHKMSVPKVYDLMHSVHVKKRRDEIIDQLNNCGFGGMLHICNWIRIHTFFIDWVVRRFEKEHMWIRLSDTEVLELKEDDVHRVYELPMAGKKIDTNLCSDGAIRRLRKELGLTGDYSPVVKVAELERILKTTEKPKTWVKGIICFIIHNILCPTNKGNVSLQYADILEDPAGVSSYNWCSHVLDYMKKGLQSPGVLNPLADFHFLMINYMDKMGKRSPFLTGKYKRPSLRDWDVKAANQELAKIHDIMGLENGLTAGVTSLYRPAEGPLVLCFDADTCPLSKAEMYLNHCRSCINIYTRSATTLERRIAEATVGTSGKKDAVPEETKTDKDNPMEAQAETEKNNSSNKDNDADKHNDEGLNNDNDAEDEINAKSIDEDDNDEKDEINAVIIDEDDNDEDEIITKMIDDSVKAATKIIDDSVKLTMTPETNNVGLTLTQETIIKFPEFFDGAEASNAGFDKNHSVSQGTDSVTQETISKFPELFDGAEASYAELNNDDLVKKDSVPQETDSELVLVPHAMHQENPTKSDSNVVINAIPLKSIQPDEIIDLDNVTPKKRKKHNMLYSDNTYPERRRAVKKSKYLASPYDDAVHKSAATELQKKLSTYAWNPELDEDHIMYCSDNKAHLYSLQRADFWTLQKDEWVSCFVINSWVNCLNWNQQDNMTRLVTPLVNYFDMERMPPVTKSIAHWRFVDRLKNFKYMDWKAIDPTKLEYIMTPAIAGNPGSHYVCFVVNFKSHKFEFLNSLTGGGEKLQLPNGEPSLYKQMFDVWLNEVEAFVTELYKLWKIKMPFQFTTFNWDTPKVPTQVDSDNCGVFCMKFLDEWGGEMQSFKGWSKLRKHGDNGKIAKIMDLRIDLCSAILTNSSNSRKEQVLKDAT
ncbi:uncharacterized protein LOC123918979 [Trifolium pratense]|nr:uncharacterized protein LOC123918979 [Trifolium pratense]